MAYFFIAALGISIAGMASLLVLKRYELSTGRVILGARRPAVGAFFHRTLQWIEYVLPGLVRVGVRRSYLFVRAVLRAWAGRLAVRVEALLERALHRVRNTAPTLISGGQSSQFLKEVAEHKKQVKRRIPKKIILEE